MKVPRIEDFDPNATPKLGSPMEDLPRIEKPHLQAKLQIPEPTLLPLVAPPKANRNETTPTGNRDTTTPRYRDTTVSRYHDTTLTLVRKAVKEFGKEAATHRFTQEEKQAIADLIYTFRQRGIRTSENEITRIAVNFVVEDFKHNGEGSVLDRVLNLLNQ